MKLCMGCMSEIQDSKGVCPFCGYDMGNIPPSGIYLPPGTVLAAQYAVGKCIGHGGFGITYIGWDAKLAHRVAVKEFFPETLCTRQEGELIIRLKSKEVKQRYQNGLDEFIAEARRLAKLENVPGIAHIYNSFLENHTGYIVMEYLEGMDVRKILKSNQVKSFSYDDACEIMIPVLQTLRQIHANHILHRDIAPDNIFLTKDEDVKLLDFGAAKHAASENNQQEIFLKRGYAPVEQYKLNGNQGTWTDVYAAAAVFYHLLTGMKPIESKKRDEEGIHLQELSQMGVSLPEKAENAIMMALQIEPKYRLQNADEFLEALDGTYHLKKKKERTEEERKREEEREKEKEEKKKKERWERAILAFSGIFVIAVISITVYLLNRPEKEVKVDETEYAVIMPNLESMSYDDALKELKKEGFDEKQISYVYEYTPDSETMDIVIAQSINSEERFSEIEQEDLNILLTLSGADQKVTLPNLIGMTLEEAQEILEKNSGDIVTLLYQDGFDEDEDKKGKIIEQSIPGGEVYDVSEGGLTVVKSVGREEEYTIKLPNFKGGNYQEILEKKYTCLDGSKKKISFKKKDKDSAELKGTVLGQSVKEGENYNTLTDQELILSVSKGNRKAKVPSVTGKMETSAKALLDKNGFSYTVSTKNSSKKAGTVLSYSPKMAKKGSKVHLIISAGEESIRVNDVIGQSENTAVNRLQDQGFSVYVTREYNDFVTKGYVISYSPQKAKRGDIITIVVSKGEKKKPKKEPEKKPNHHSQEKKDDKVTVPYLIGMTKTQAKTAIRNAGLSVGNIEDTISNYVSIGQVDSYEPTGKVKKGTKINIFICSGTLESDYDDDDGSWD